MPYFVYRIENLPIRRLEKLSVFEVFKEASAFAKQQRASQTLPEGVIIKVIYAENELVAEDLLSQVREAPPRIGDDY
ncbi:hypothetical protein [Thiobacter aerophilum]|uniref:Uncharacterized protein n=1 Tax=Thiobacter aerophilum TaxID=3121275 RepID=A0ABV0EE72_9BURK